MELPIIVLAYAAALAVAVTTTAVFSRAIDRVLRRMIHDDLVSSWSLFIKFALLVTTFTGGMPATDTGKFVGFTLPAVTPPVAGDGTMFVMKAVGAALLSASWFLLVFFAVTLTAGAAARLWGALRAKREEDAREAESDKKEESDKKGDLLSKAAAAQEKMAEEPVPAEPPKRAEPEGRRPVEKEEPSRPLAREKHAPRPKTTP